MLIRRLVDDELESLLELYSHLHESDLPLPSREVVQEVWTSLTSSELHPYFGGFVGESLVSSCNLTIVPNLTRGCRPFGVIENVVTHTEHRKRDYGRRLLEHALERAWSSGCYKVMLLTGRKDEATFSFYEGAGFDRHVKQAFLAKPVT